MRSHLVERRRLSKRWESDTSLQTSWREGKNDSGYYAYAELPMAQASVPVGRSGHRCTLHRLALQGVGQWWQVTEQEVSLCRAVVLEHSYVLPRHRATFPKAGVVLRRRGATAWILAEALSH